MICSEASIWYCFVVFLKKYFLVLLLSKNTRNWRFGNTSTTGLNGLGAGSHEDG